MHRGSSSHSKLRGKPTSARNKNSSLSVQNCDGLIHWNGEHYWGVMLHLKRRVGCEDDYCCACRLLFRFCAVSVLVIIGSISSPFQFLNHNPSSNLANLESVFWEISFQIFSECVSTIVLVTLLCQQTGDSFLTWSNLLSWEIFRETAKWIWLNLRKTLLKNKINTRP